MSEQPFAISIEEMYGDPGLDDAAIEAILARSLDPRPSTMLYDKMGELGLRADHLVLDIGSRDARHACELVRRYGCRIVGVEPVAHNRKLAEAVIQTAQMVDQVRVVEGGIEAIPAEVMSFDYIWCRDVLTHVGDLHRGFRECARVLKPGGAMLNYQTFATELLEPNEAARLYPALAVVPRNMSTDYFEQALEDTGLQIVARDEIGSEWREWWEENGQQTTSKQLLTLARLRRDRTRLIQELGRTVYENELANCHWGVYQMLGKLSPQCITLRKI